MGLTSGPTAYIRAAAVSYYIKKNMALSIAREMSLKMPLTSLNVADRSI
jgi:hypothetical protein